MSKLRKLAQKKLQENPENYPLETQDDLVKVVEELRIYQIELEHQNQELTQAQENLQLIHEKYTDLFETAPVGYITIDQDGVIVEANQTMLGMLDIKKSDLRGKRLERLIPPDDQDKLHFFRQEAGSKQAVCSVDLKIKRADGETFYARLTSRGQGADDAQALNRETKIAILDISVEKSLEFKLKTERDKAQTSARDLAESQERYERVTEANLDGVWDWDLETNAIYYSPNWKRLLGYEPHELEDKFSVWEELTHPDDVSAAWEMMEQHIAGNRDRFDIIIRMRHKAGHWTFIRSRALALRDDKDRAVRVVGSHTDVNEQMHARHEIENIHSIYRRSIENAMGVPYHLDLTTGEFLFIGENLEQVIGIKVEDFTRDRFFALIRERRFFSDPVPESLEQYGQDFRNGLLDLFQLDIRIQIPNGEERWIHDISLPIIDEGTKKVIGSYGILQDVTERYRAHAAQERLQKQLYQAQKLESLGALTGGIAHDFNNILASILLNLEVIKDDRKVAGIYSGTMDTIFKGIKRAADLIKQMLDYAGAGLGEKVPVNVKVLFHDTLGILSASIPKKIVITQELYGGPVSILGDPTQLQQVLMNLLINASEAIGDKSGRIAIKSEVRQLDESWFAQDHLVDMSHERPLNPGPYYVIRISDSGGGISKEDLEKIFDPFFTTKFTGRGLGLSAVLGIIQRHDGAILLDSEQGRGTEFTIALPLVETQESAPTLTEPDEDVHLPGPQPGAKNSILIAEDEASIRAAVEHMLNEEGWNVFAAENGEEALQIFKSNREIIACVVLDFMMPKFDGGELFDVLHKLEPDIPVILASGWSRERIKERFGDRLAGYLQKPFRMHDLKLELKSVL